ncbi:ribonuclease HIII [Firmicutes bacterium M10-2]|nr:ribonuclease HIII [Firmicutes bacterium M10-2]
MPSFGFFFIFSYTMSMASITKKMTYEQIMNLKKRIEPLAVSIKQPAYTHYQIQTPSLTITAYESGKVVYQGKDVSFLEEDNLPQNHSSALYPQAGSDEVGTGDYFGPVVVAACIVYEEHVDTLKKLEIQDSKQMNDENIRKIAPIIQKLCPNSVLIVNNMRYNCIHERLNMNAIKAKLHNQSYLNLIKKGFSLPDLCVVDQFTPKPLYYNYLKDEPEVIRTLTFETKAENKYLAVACASVLARDSFLRYFDKMNEKYAFEFSRGAGPAVDQCGKRFVEKYGFDALKHVAKLHFKNTEKIRNLRS